MSIFLSCFLPFIIYLYGAVYSFSVTLGEHITEGKKTTWGIIQIANTFIMTFYFLVFEIVQMKSVGFKYLSEFQNWIEAISSTLNICIILKSQILGQEKLYGFE